MALSSDLQLATSAVLARQTDPLASVAASALADHGRALEGTLKGIAQDPDLSDQGKANRRGNALQKFQDAIAGWRAEVTQPLEKTAEILEQRLRDAAAPAPIDPIEGLRRELRHGEIRRQLEHLDPLLLQGSFQQLPSEVQEAMRAAPPKLVTSDRGEWKWVSLAPPEPAPMNPELQHVRDLVGALSGLANQAQALAKKEIER